MQEIPVGSTSTLSATSPRGRTNWVRALIVVLVLAVAGFAFAWKAGAMRSRPKIAILTSTEDVYWDRLIQGGESAAKYFDAQVTPIRCPSDDNVQSQKIRELVTQGIEGIIVSPVKPEAQTSLFNE